MAERIPDGIAEKHVRLALKDFDAGVPHRFGPSIVYDVVFEGRRYPPKAIVGLAAARFNGSALGPDDFNGGEKSKCFRILRRLGFTIELKATGKLFPEELDDAREHLEGSLSRIVVNRYERDPIARLKCIAHFGTTCQICRFDFNAAFGEIGTGFIHVHHLRPLSEIKMGYVVDPKSDLCPVCPNCHAMLHRRNPPFTVDELRSIIGGKR